MLLSDVGLSIDYRGELWLHIDKKLDIRALQYYQDTNYEIAANLYWEDAQTDELIVEILLMF